MIYHRVLVFYFASLSYTAQYFSLSKSKAVGFRLREIIEGFVLM